MCPPKTHRFTQRQRTSTLGRAFGITPNLAVKQPVISVNALKTSKSRRSTTNLELVETIVLSDDDDNEQPSTAAAVVQRHGSRDSSNPPPSTQTMSVASTSTAAARTSANQSSQKVIWKCRPQSASLPFDNDIDDDDDDDDFLSKIIIPSTTTTSQTSASQKSANQILANQSLPSNTHTHPSTSNQNATTAAAAVTQSHGGKQTVNKQEETQLWSKNARMFQLDNETEKLTRLNEVHGTYDWAEFSIDDKRQMSEFQKAYKNPKPRDPKRRDDIEGYVRADLKESYDDDQLVFSFEGEKNIESFKSGWKEIELKYGQIMVNKRNLPSFTANNSRTKIANLDDLIRVIVTRNLVSDSKLHKFFTSSSTTKVPVDQLKPIAAFVLLRCYFDGSKLKKTVRFIIKSGITDSAGKELECHFDPITLHTWATSKQRYVQLYCRSYKGAKNQRCTARIAVDVKVMENIDQYIFKELPVFAKEMTHMCEQCLWSENDRFSGKVDVNRVIPIDIYRKEPEVYWRYIGFLRETRRIDE